MKKLGKMNDKNVEAMYNKMVRDYNEYQDLYDLETDHSTNEKKQQEWNEKVKYELAALENYSSYQSF